jgi:putative peptide zinc metalloprotease protein
MVHGNRIATTIDDLDYLCPDLTVNWQLDDRIDRINQVILQAKVGNRRYQFEGIEGYALKYFTGQYTARQILNRCRSRFGTFIPSDLIVRLLEKLNNLEILTATVEEKEELEHPQPDDPSPNSPPPKTANFIQLKSTVEWIPHPDGYWILRNPEDLTCLQIDDGDKEIISQLSQDSIIAVVNKYDISLDDVQYLMQMLAKAGMLEGVKPPKPSNKFSLQKLLYCKIPVLNPDTWLTQHIDKIRWIWTWQFGYALCAFITTSVSLWLAFSNEILDSSKQVWTGGTTAILTLALLTALVVSLHELGHAFTLKYYGGVVPEIGLLFMCLIPGCYTNTTDQYALVRRKERILVVAAGVLVQVTIWAVAVYLWVLSSSNPWLHNASFLLMTASLMTVALNLNPMNRFDGYYLLVALTGINNLRERSFQFYTDLLQRQESLEDPADQWILAGYAPFSIIYTALILSYLMSLVGNWILLNLPTAIDLTKLTLPHF